MQVGERLIVIQLLDFNKDATHEVSDFMTRFGEILHIPLVVNTGVSGDFRVIIKETGELFSFCCRHGPDKRDEIGALKMNPSLFKLPPPFPVKQPCCWLVP